jgi:hypothetical protein
MSARQIARSRPRLSLRKRVAFTALLAVGVWLVLEALSFIAYRVVAGETLSLAEVRSDQRRIAAGAAPVEGREVFSGMCQHPYLGFVFDPVRTAAPTAFGTNAHGFNSPEGPVVTREPDVVTVAVFGGSVGQIFAATGFEVLARELRSHPSFRYKRVRLVSFAVGAYKQPQHLLALSYALGLGSAIDIAINIDGFNEVALPPANAAAGVYPFFPQDWASFVRQNPDRTLLRRLAKIESLQSGRRGCAEIALALPVAWSPLAAVTWKIVDRNLAAALVAAEHEHQSAPSDHDSFATTGPRAEFASDRDLYAACTDLWRRCSTQMARLCEANRIGYLHFLQPNQYVEGSKPLSEDERRHAISEDSPYCKHAREGYPPLRAAGAALARDGVRFHDLTMLFAGVTETVYVDTCCHFNQLGNDMLARAVARAVLDAFAGEPASMGEVQALAIEPAELDMTEPLEIRQLAVSGRFPDGGTRSVTYGVEEFSSTDPSVATVSEHGAVQALRPGRAQIRATVGGCSATIPVAVAFAPVAPFGAASGCRRTVPLLRAAFAGERVEFELEGAPVGTVGTLLGWEQPLAQRWCASTLVGPVNAALQVPIVTDSARRRAILTPPTQWRGRTTYWQVVLADPGAACGWCASRGVAVTIPD